MTLPNDGIWLDPVGHAEHQMRQRISQHAAEQDQARHVAIGEEMAERPEEDAPGERKTQKLTPTAAEQEYAQAEKSHEHQNECGKPAPWWRLIDGNKRRHLPAENDHP